MSDIVERLYDRAVCSPPQNSCRNDWLCDQAAAEITRLRADLAQLEQESDAEISALRACLASAEADLAAAQEREQRMREALETARGLYQVTHIHAAIDAALGEPQ